MNDLERRLKRSLLEVREAHHASIAPEERFEARRSLMQRLQRRRTVNAVTVAAAGAAVVALSVFVATRSAPVERSGLDPAKAPATQPLESVAVGRAPSDIAVGGLGNVWTANQAENSLTRVDPSTAIAMSPIQLTSRPGDIAIATGPVWVALPTEGAVAKVDPETGQESPPIRVSRPGVEMELTVGPNLLWIVSKGQALYRLPAGSTTKEPVTIAPRPIDVAVHDAVGYVLDEDGTVTTFDQATGNKGATFSLPAGEAGDLIFAAGALWHFSGIDGVLRKIDPSSGAEVARFETGGTILDLAIDPMVAWVLVRDDDGVHRLIRIDRTDASTTGDDVILAGQAVEAAISGGKLWVTDRSGGRVLAFDKLP
jgi:streptogramin lyase